MYSLHWYLGSHRKTGKKSITKFFSFLGVQEKLFLSLASTISFLFAFTRVFLSMKKQEEVFSIFVASCGLSIVLVFTSCIFSCSVKKMPLRVELVNVFFSTDV